jgi:hypothetical protein
MEFRSWKALAGVNRQAPARGSVARGHHAAVSAPWLIGDTPGIEADENIRFSETAHPPWRLRPRLLSRRNESQTGCFPWFGRGAGRCVGFLAPMAK